MILIPFIFLFLSCPEGLLAELDPLDDITFYAYIVWRDCAANDPCRDSDEKELVCSGALIAPHVVVTSTSCFFRDPRMKSYSARGLSRQWNANYSSSEIMKITHFEGWPEFGFGHADVADFVDLSVVILRLGFTDKLSYLRLTKMEDIPESWNATIAGFGQAKIDGDWQDHQTAYRKEYVNVPVDACRRFVREDQPPFYDLSSDHHVCMATGKATDHYTLCKGAPGTPLIQNGVLFGILSFLPQNCTTWPVAVFTKLFPFNSWVGSVGFMDYSTTVILRRKKKYGYDL